MAKPSETDRETRNPETVGSGSGVGWRVWTRVWVKKIFFAGLGLGSGFDKYPARISVSVTIPEYSYPYPY